MPICQLFDNSPTFGLLLLLFFKNLESQTTGVYQPTLSLTLDIETYTLPIKQKFDYFIAKTALHIAFSPSYLIIIAAQPEKQFLFNPFKILTNHLQKIFQSSISNLKQIIPYAAPPWLTPPPTIIKSSKKKQN